MAKKLLTFITGLGMLCGVAAAQSEAVFAASDIVYWVGEGQNEMVFVVNWADTALAWGYRFDDEGVGMTTVMADIAAADPRFNYTTSGGYLTDITFSESDQQHAVTPGNYFNHTNNGIASSGMGCTFADGDFSKWADPKAGVVVDSTYYDYGEYSFWDYTYVFPMTIHAVSAPEAEVSDATINPSQIAFWAGRGSHSAILAVNWADPDTCLAWGVRFDEELTVKGMMDSVAAADGRFAYEAAGSFLSDIVYADNGDTLRLTTYSDSPYGNWWTLLVNGTSSMDYFTNQPVADGDLVKWGDPNSGVAVGTDEWGMDIMVWTTKITPAQPAKGEFCGGVGTEGCNAIAADSSAILAWATACTVTRGPMDISVEGSPAVSYGDDQMAVGPVSMNDNLTVVSLGDGGSALLTFAKPIKNGKGPDFAVFENSFDDNFLELAFVEVSSDGERFVRFPAVSLTQTAVQTGGNGSTDPTMINNLAGKFRMGYGTPFDLDELKDSTGLDVNSITHVRIVDVVGSIDPRYGTRDSRGNLINDPWPTDNYSGGFDLAGVAVLHQQGDGIDDVASASFTVYPNPATDAIVVAGADGSEAVLYDATGRRLMNFTVRGAQCRVDLGQLAGGVYMLRIGSAVQKIVKR
ncbi:MAG: T9SS type A sorting domain-containing protein [Bacteroidales bacterium]|nr:T9SS type A sorting domain-containing protein [Bacteroidales bacterium]